jgi:hypothetical protein
MTKFLFIAATATVALATQAQAQGEGGGRMQRDVTRQQTQQMTDMMFQRFDINHDGVLTRQEAEQGAAQMGGGDEGRRGGRAERMIARLFGDQQSVTLAQAEGQALARFDAEDLNHDGIVSSAERDQARAARQQGK